MEREHFCMFIKYETANTHLEKLIFEKLNDPLELHIHSVAINYMYLLSPENSTNPK